MGRVVITKRAHNPVEKLIPGSIPGYPQVKFVNNKYLQKNARSRQR